MSCRPEVLVVARTPALGQTLFGWFTAIGYNAALATSFSSGKLRLQREPALLVAEIRLGEYNGLHLALRAQAQDIPAIVIGETDAVLEREAQRMGVIYLTPNVDREYMTDLANHLTGRSTNERVDVRRDGAAAALSFLSLCDLATVGALSRRGRATAAAGRRIVN
jgi:DNA-binding response OmpR family regulator